MSTKEEYIAKIKIYDRFVELKKFDKYLIELTNSCTETIEMRIYVHRIDDIEKNNGVEDLIPVGIYHYNYRNRDVAMEIFDSIVDDDDIERYLLLSRMS